MAEVGRRLPGGTSGRGKDNGRMPGVRNIFSHGFSLSLFVIDFPWNIGDYSQL